MGLWQKIGIVVVSVLLAGWVCFIVVGLICQENPRRKFLQERKKMDKKLKRGKK